MENKSYLLPEIALTKQIIQRLKLKIEENNSAFIIKTSQISEKVEVRAKSQNNEIKILTGTSSLFFRFRI